MHPFTKKIKELSSSDKKLLFDLQQKYIGIETKLLFERDRQSKSLLRNQLKELAKKRREILKANN